MGRSPNIANMLLLTALAAGVLAGLAEVCWSYLLPAVSAAWRGVLPTTAGGLLAFIVAAVVTDTVLLIFAGALLLALGGLVIRLTPLSGTSRRLHTLARAAVLSGLLCYLYLGWMALFVLLGEQHRMLSYWLILSAGAVGLILLAGLLSVLLEAVRRRWRRLTPARLWCASVVVLLIATIVPFGRYRAAQQIDLEIPLSPGGPRPNVLLVTIDTLRVDYLGCYGHPWIETPTLDELAVHGVVFDCAIAQAPSTGPSHCSLMTSVYPFDHGAENGKPMKPGLVTLADVLRANGYETVAFTSATTTRSINSGLQQGFDQYVDSLVTWSTVFSHDEFQHLMLFYLLGIARHSQIPGDVVTDRALAWLDRRAVDKPFFAWLHYFDPHYPYGSPPPFQGMYRGRITDDLPRAANRERYAEDVSYADFQFGRFLDALRQKGLYDGMLIVVASDHGEAFGEMHGDIAEFLHGRYLYDTTQWVPLIIKPVAARLLARRVSEQVELCDVAPTILSLLGIDSPNGFVGKPLDELLDGRPYSYPARDAYSFNIIDLVHPGAPPHQVEYVQQLAVRSPEWKYIARPRVHQGELYNLRDDPAERINVARDYPETAAERHARITPFWTSERDASRDPRQRLAPALVRQLQALGYLGGAEDEDEPDEHAGATAREP